MQAQQQSPADRSPVSDLLDWLKEWRLNWGVARELESCDPREIDRILSEFVVTLEDLRRARGCASEQAELLARMMTALGIDSDVIARNHPVLVRDMQRVCLWCDAKRQCRRDLEAGRIAGEPPSYCSNAPTLAAISTPAASVELSPAS